MYKYFLSVTLAGEKIEREVSVAEYCMAERVAGFYPKTYVGSPDYLTTPATGGFGSPLGGVSGRSQYFPD